MSFTSVYKSLLDSVLNGGLEETNARTGVKIKMLRGGTAFKLDLQDGFLPVASNRAYFPHIAAAEVAWQLMGTKDPSFILEYAPLGS